VTIKQPFYNIHNVSYFRGRGPNLFTMGKQQGRKVLYCCGSNLFIIVDIASKESLTQSLLLKRTGNEKKFGEILLKYNKKGFLLYKEMYK
jgi:hypothetical protein